MGRIMEIKNSRSYKTLSLVSDTECTSYPPCFTENLTKCSPLFCDAVEESVEHLFLHCPFIICIWRQAPWPVNLAVLELQSIVEWIKIVLDPSQMLNLNLKLEHSFMLYAVIAMDSIWFTRNQVVHNHIPADPNQILLASREAIDNIWLPGAR